MKHIKARVAARNNVCPSVPSSKIKRSQHLLDWWNGRTDIIYNTKLSDVCPSVHPSDHLFSSGTFFSNYFLGQSPWRLGAKPQLNYGVDKYVL